MAAKKQTDLPTPYQTLNRWFNSAAMVDKLREIVESDTFKVAVAVLKDATKPSFRTMAKTTEDNAARYAWYAGYCDALSDLEKLSVLPVHKGQVEPEEWTHIEN